MVQNCLRATPTEGEEAGVGVEKVSPVVGGGSHPSPSSSQAQLQNSQRAAGLAEEPKGASLRRAQKDPLREEGTEPLTPTYVDLNLTPYFHD